MGHSAAITLALCCACIGSDNEGMGLALYVMRDYNPHYSSTVLLLYSLATLLRVGSCSCGYPTTLALDWELPKTCTLLSSYFTSLANVQRLEKRPKKMRVGNG
jgi:hypothetical protein